MQAESVWEYVKPISEFRENERYSHAVITTLVNVLQNESPIGLFEIAEKTGYQYKTIINLLYIIQKYYGAVRLVGVRNKRIVNLEELQNYSSVKTWLSNLKQSENIRDPKYRMSKFLRYLREKTRFKDPDELIKHAMNCTKGEFIEHLNIVKDYIAWLPSDLEASTREKEYNTIRGFYKHNLVELPHSPLTSLDSHEVKIELDMTPDEAFDMLGWIRKTVRSQISTRDRAVMIIKLQGAMDNSTLATVWNYSAFSQIVKHYGTEDFTLWDSSKVPVRIHLYRPKTTRGKKIQSFYNFLHKDAVESLKDYLTYRYFITKEKIKIHPPSREDKIATSDPIFLTERGTPLSSKLVGGIFREAGMRSGAIKKHVGSSERFRGAKIRYNFHAHEVRDCVISLAAVKSHVVVGKFCAGHPIDSLKYDKSPWKDYSHFTSLMEPLWPFLNVLSSDPEKESLHKQVATLNEEKEKLSNEYFIKSKRLEEKQVKTDKLVALLAETTRLGLQRDKASPEEVERINLRILEIQKELSEIET